MRVKATVQDLASVAMSAVIDKLGNRLALNKQIAEQAADATRRHIRARGAIHTTANKLGATPTEEMIKAARRVTHDANDSEGWVETVRFLFRRAFESFTIRPREAKELTLPIHALSYGRRAYELARMGFRLFRPIKKGAKAGRTRRGSDGKARRVFARSARQPLLLGKRDSDPKPIALYSLRQSVRHKQDRTLLPSNEQYMAIARKAAAQYAATLITP